MYDPIRASDEVIARLRANHPSLIDLTTGRVERLLAALGHPERRLPPVIHVAGTNGKGSTVAYMRAIAEAAGLKVHVLTSPHLVRFAERTPSLRTLDLNEAPISKGALCDALRKLPGLIELGLGDILVTNGVVDALAQDGTLSPNLTYLRLYNCENVAGSSLIGLARARSIRAGGKLQRLDADLCKHVTNADISRIRGTLDF